jgi:hypothetical protein
MSHGIPEAKVEDLQTIQCQVFLFETRSLLVRTYGMKDDFKLEYKIEENPSRGGDGGHYVELYRNGEQVTQCHIHPVHGDAKSVAYILSLTGKPVRLAGK